MNTLFIVNPTSGKKDKSKVIGQIEKFCADSQNQTEIWLWKNEKDITNRVQQAIADEVKVLVAVGGDGTIHYIGKHLINTNIALGIIPAGTGNGIAGHLGIPLSTKRALEVLKKPKIVSIDTGLIDDAPFIGFVGFGLDASVAHAFANATNRTFFEYFRLCLKYYFREPNATYHITIDGKQIVWQNKIFSIMNCAQYGNSAIVTPGGSMKDGILDVCGLRYVPVWKMPYNIIRIFLGTIDHCQYYDRVFATDILIERQNPGPAQIDGEPFMSNQSVKIGIAPKSLKVAIPQKKEKF